MTPSLNSFTATIAKLLRTISGRIKSMARVSATSKRIFTDPFIIFRTGLILIITLGLLVFAVTQGQSQVTIIAWMAGWFSWTFAEYVLNRWLFHHPESDSSFVRRIRSHHSMHHMHPDDMRYIFFHPLIILISTMVVFAAGLVADPASSSAVTSGFLFGYLIFIFLHIAQHHYNSPSTGFLKVLWQNHFLHHHDDGDKAFGVSTRFWDYIFQTLPHPRLFLKINPTAQKLGSPALRAIEVNDRRLEQVFLDVPCAVFANDPNWIAALQSEIRSIFNPSLNPYYKHGIARRWIVINESGEVYGRIAAFINFKKMYDEGKTVGAIGFFDCLNHRDAAFLLFDTAIKWLRDYYQIDIVEGPVNFGENDKYWGLLIKGFGPPSYGMNYNLPYYRQFFEAYGFEIQYRQLTNYVDLRKPLPERFTKIAQRVIRHERYRFERFRYQERGRFINDFVEIYNAAWASFNNFQPMNVDVVRKSLKDMKSIMDENFIWFVYADEKPAGVLLAVPDANEILKYAGSRLDLLGKLKFVFYKYWKGFSCVRVVVMGVVPEFQQRGLESGLILHAYQAGKTNPRYKHVQLAWVGDFNHKMIAIHEAMNATEIRQHATFRKLIPES